MTSASSTAPPPPATPSGCPTWPRSRSPGSPRAAVRLDDLADAGLPLTPAHALRYDGTGLRALHALATAGHGLVPLPRRIAEAGAGAPGAPEPDRRGRCARRTPHGRIPV
ncbi:hypothetical protein [Streptomyces sp. NPDC001594]|uniref:hypothetical protein n=1 Tax=Streptomyces sp. NPDC001594 TaxID=3364590 RepID=UPI0036B8E92E